MFYLFDCNRRRLFLPDAGDSSTTSLTHTQNVRKLFVSNPICCRLSGIWWYWSLAAAEIFPTKLSHDKFPLPGVCIRLEHRLHQLLPIKMLFHRCDYLSCSYASVNYVESSRIQRNWQLCNIFCSSPGWRFAWNVIDSAQIKRNAVCGLLI